MSLLLPDNKPDEEYLLPDNVLVPIDGSLAEEERLQRDGELGDEYDADELYMFVVVFVTDWIYPELRSTYFFLLMLLRQ